MASKKLSYNDIADKDLFKPIVDQFKLVQEEAKKTEKIISESFKKDNKEFQIVNPNTLSDVKKLESLVSSLQGKIKKLEETKKANNQIDNERIRLEKRLNDIQSESAKKNFELKEQIKEQSRQSRELAKEKLGLVGLYQRESKKLNDLQARYKEVALSQGFNSREAKKLQKETIALDKRLKKVDENVGRYNRSVGNYGKAWKGVSTILASAGILGGLAGVFRVLRDGFNQIREFDKELTNLAAIAGESRGELRDLENVIRLVAKTSINTAIEVAKTATALVTLGKTKKEIVNLLEPVNNLSIALRATSEESGELLITTLNAFGESSTEAQKYADIIAKMRMTTALDFERIKDSLSFLSPVARAVGLNLERTGAILGTLVDNSIRASRAGRLMSSSFSRLAVKGITLDDALDKINNSTDKVKTATELFGAESFSLALILADNTDKINGYTEAFENAGGSLQELTDKQLTSLDSQLKILNSTWSEFIFSLENGEGVISRVLKGVIRESTETLQWLRKFVLTQDQLNEDLIIRSSTLQVKELRNEIDRVAKSFEKAFGEENVNKVSIINDEIENQKSLLDAAIKDYRRYLSLFDDVNEADPDTLNAYIVEIETFRRIIEGLEDYKNVTDEVAESTEKATKAAKEAEKTLKNRIEILKFNLETEIRILQETTKNEKASLNERLAASELVVQKKIKLAGLEKRLLIETQKEITKEEIELINLKFKESVRIAKAEGEKIAANLFESLNKPLSETDFNEILKDRLNNLEKALNEEVAIINEAFAFGEISRKDYNNTIEELESEHKKNLIKQEIAFLENKGLLQKLSTDEELRLSQLRKGATDIEVDEKIKSQERYLAYLQNLKDDINTAISALAEIERQKTERRLNNIDREIAAEENRLQRLQELADKGNESAADNLAVAQKRQAELELERERQLQRQQKSELAISAINTYGAKVASGEANALGSTITDITLLRQFISSLPAFYEGSERVGDDLTPVMSGKDGHVIRVDGNERIFNPAHSAMIPKGISNFEAASIISNSVKPKSTNKANDVDYQLLKELKDLKSITANKPVYLGSGYDAHRMAVIDIVKKGNTLERKHKKIGGIWGNGR